MNKKKKNKRVIAVMYRKTIELLLGFKYGIIEELNKIATIIQVLIPVYICHIGADLKTALMLSIVFYVLVKYIKEVGYELNNKTERGFPVPTKRYTDIDRNGFLNIPDDELHEAIQYLYEVEEYINKKGWSR